MTSSPDTGLRMAVAALAWLLGIGLQMQQPALWPDDAYVVLVLAALSMLAMGFGLTRGSVPRWRWCSVCWRSRCWASAARAGARTCAWRRSCRPQLEGRDLQLTGVVARMPQLGPTGSRFVFQVEQAWLAGEPVLCPSASRWAGTAASMARR